MLGVAAIAALAVSFAAPAQDIDNRPIYYVMLKSLESGFKSYNDELVSKLDERIAQLRARYQPDRDEISAAFEKLEADRKQKTKAFNSKRDALNERIEALNEQIALHDGRESESRRGASRYAGDAQVKSLMQGLAAERARLLALEKNYRAELQAAQAARAALTRKFERYAKAGEPLALEIRSLEQKWQRYAEGERAKLKKLADGYADDYAAYGDWVDHERAALEELRSRVAESVNTDREQRALHAKLKTELDHLIEQYNELVDVHNRAGSDDPGRDERAKRFAELEERIAGHQRALTHARDAVVKANEDFLSGNREYDQRYERFTTEKRKREARLAGDLADVNAARAAAEADIAARRRKVDAQIKTLETRISGELAGARGTLETLNRKLVDDFGRNHQGLDAAINKFLNDGDDEALYAPDGAPRFDLSRPMTAAAYRSVEQMLTSRRKLDARIALLEERGGASQQAAANPSPPAGDLERERAALAAERQQLLEAHAGFARKSRSLSASLEKRRAKIERQIAGERASLEELFSLRADVTRSEFQLVQQVLVGAIRGGARTSADPHEHSRLLDRLRERSKRSGTSAGASMVDPHALLDHIGSGLPGDASAHRAWRAFTRDQVIGTRALSGDDKAMMAFAWLARYRRQPRFGVIARELDETGAVASGSEALATLFLDGVINYAAIEELRLAGGDTGVRVGVLEREYLLEENGSLGRLPDE